MSELPEKENNLENEGGHEESNIELHDSINDDTNQTPSAGRTKRKAAAKARLIFEVLDEIMDTDELPAKTDSKPEPTTSLEDALANSKSSQQVKKTSLKRKFDSVDQENGDFEANVSELIEDLDGRLISKSKLPLVEKNKIKEVVGTNECSNCGKKYSRLDFFRTHVKKCGINALDLKASSVEESDESRPLKRPRINEPIPKKKWKLPIECGKCGEIFTKSPAFKNHVASVHGGVALPKDEDQNMTEKDILTAIQEAYKTSKELKCYLCNEKAYKSFEGYKIHLVTCGKTEEQLESVYKKCQFADCEYKTCHLSLLKSHIRTWHKQEVESADKAETEIPVEEEAPVLTASGRRGRKAASKASKKMSEVL